MKAHTNNNKYQVAMGRREGVCDGHDLRKKIGKKDKNIERKLDDSTINMNEEGGTVCWKKHTHFL